LLSGGASIGSVGSVQGVETILRIGTLPVVEDDIRAINGFLVRIEADVQSKASKLESFAAVINKATPAQIEEQMGMQFEIDELNLRSKQLLAARAGLEDIFSNKTTPRLETHKALYSKVVVFLPGYRAEFPTDLMGESIIEIGQTGHPSITYRGQTTPLSEHARVMPDDSILRISQPGSAPTPEAAA